MALLVLGSAQVAGTFVDFRFIRVLDSVWSHPAQSTPVVVLFLARNDSTDRIPDDRCARGDRTDVQQIRSAAGAAARTGWRNRQGPCAGRPRDSAKANVRNESEREDEVAQRICDRLRAVQTRRSLRHND